MITFVSGLRRIKTWLCNTIWQNRLNGPGLLQYVKIEVFMWTETISSGLMDPGTGELCCNVFVLYMFCTVLCRILYVFAIVNCKNDSVLVCIWIWSAQLTRLRTFIPDICTHSQGMPPPRTASGSASAPGSVFVLVHTNGVWPLLWLVSVAQKNTPSTMLSFTVQSVDLPMEWMARRDNGMAGQTPTRDLVRPSTGLKELLIRWKRSLDWLMAGR